MAERLITQIRKALGLPENSPPESVIAELRKELGIVDGQVVRTASAARITADDVVVAIDGHLFRIVPLSGTILDKTPGGTARFYTRLFPSGLGSARAQRAFAKFIADNTGTGTVSVSALRAGTGIDPDALDAMLSVAEQEGRVRFVDRLHFEVQSVPTTHDAADAKASANDNTPGAKRRVTRQ
jgi:hypothetical protein